jgi:hypothetical protein
MKLSEISRYWAAKELTRIEVNAAKPEVSFKAPFSCEEFTVKLPFSTGRPTLSGRPLDEVATRLQLKPDSWCREQDKTLVCLKLSKGVSKLSVLV